MPWQQLIADVGLELLDNGRPAYRQVIFTVPRQSGKTTLILSWELLRALYWAAFLKEPQRIIYSAQTQKDAREKLVDDQFPPLIPLKKRLEIRTFRKAIGSEGIYWRNGSRLGILAGTESSGHGKTLDLAIKDELFHDVDFRRDQSMGPAMITRPYAQTVTASTMGTAASTALNAEVELGRAAVDEGRTEGVAYFEWSAYPDEDPSDPDVWARCMPALGRTILPELIKGEYESFVAKGAVDEFRRAYLNIPTASDSQIIPAAAWKAVQSVDAEAQGEVFGIDVNLERDGYAIVACGAGPVLEVVKYSRDLPSLPDVVRALRDKYRSTFVVDATGPAASYVNELRRDRVHIIELVSGEYTKACGSFFDAVLANQVTVRTDEDLDRAVAGAVQRPRGDAWVWGRKQSMDAARVDVCPLVAATVAFWILQNRAPARAISLADALREAGEL